MIYAPKDSKLFPLVETTMNKLLRDRILKVGGTPEDFIVTCVPVYWDDEDNYAIACKKCAAFRKLICPFDWSAEHFDKLTAGVLDFVKLHVERCPPLVTPQAVESVPEVKEPKTGRKFRV